MMHRVKTLADKLQQQLGANEPADKLLLTVQMLQAELLHEASQARPAESASSISIDISQIPYTKAVEPAKEPATNEKTVEVLQVDEADIEAELEEIKRNAEDRNKFSYQNKPALLFDPIEDIPTLIHQQPINKPAAKKEIHEQHSATPTASLNDKLRQAKIELSDSLMDVSIKDLKKAIGVNDRFLFINELFRGDEVMYERSIKTINGFSIFPEAEYWIKRELKLKLGWNDANEVVKQFDQLVRRRFSAM
ncbi:MAG: hypothetical protein ABIY51_01680 [Ferruginibacter sp.]